MPDTANEIIDDLIASGATEFGKDELMQALDETRKEVDDLRAQLLHLRVAASLLATHVLGHFAMPSTTSPAVCQKWAEAVQKAIAENSTN